MASPYGQRVTHVPVPPTPFGTAPRQYGPPRPPEPVIATLFGEFWPDRDAPARAGVLAGAVGLGVVAGAILPDHYFVSIAGCVVVLGLFAAALALSDNRARPYTAVVAVVVVGLASLMVLRAAPWLTALALLVAAPLVLTALTGARTAGAVAVSAVSWPLALLRAAPWVRRTATAMRRLPIGWPVVRTLALCVAALTVFGALFATGDAVFGSWVQALVPAVPVDSLVGRIAIAALVAALAVSIFYVAINPPRSGAAPVRGTTTRRRTLRRFEWLAPLLVVIAMFVGFVAAQATTMWAGHDYVQRTAGVTYAESVHRGFGQLTVATVLALLTVAAAWWLAPRHSRTDRLILVGTLAALCVLALVVVASALYRMHIYQQAYGFTALRLIVDAFELWMGLLLVLTLVAVVVSNVSFLPRAALGSAALVVLGLGVMNPDAWVAEHNVSRYRDTGKVDLRYLATLGPDARSVIVAGLPPELARCALGRPPRSSAPIEWNLGRHRAQSAAVLQSGAADDCDVARGGR